MGVKVGIKGFGGIGGKVLGGGLKNGEVEVVGVKDLRDGNMVGEVLEYDCVEGKLEGEV
ncbi:glyceraldehyde 3-phosphate dehydrogenase NAD-binding domain-containing protein [Bacillus subtilis]|uniref:glyceraldehyde 3-phosphate dehydrogenase NAD-binding domain-containing protein n=1 Tax=Bacillus subtilis TaxID=1423 RepID=UPI001642D2FC|nr:glyceraldehyde 3-phosphate dehydrogenase NAD-binding domain-containing protein [Bacillus subtilis]